MGETNVLFSIGPLEVTGAVVTMWVIVAMLALVFICLLFFNLFSQLVGFVYSLYKELALRT